MDAICSDVLIHIFSYILNPTYLDVYNIASVCKDWRARSEKLLAYVKKNQLKRSIFPQYIDTYNLYNVNLSYTSDIPYTFGGRLIYATKKWDIMFCTEQYIVIFYRYKIYSSYFYERRVDDEERKESIECILQWDYRNNKVVFHYEESNIEHKDILSNNNILNMIFLNKPEMCNKSMPVDDKYPNIDVSIKRDDSVLYNQLSPWKIDMNNFKLSEQYKLTDINFPKELIRYKYHIINDEGDYIITFTIFINIKYLKFTVKWNRKYRIVQLLDVLENTLPSMLPDKYIMSSLIDKFFLIPPKILI